MENLNDKITHLLDKKVWSDHDKQWLLHYLETSDNEHLRSLLEQQFEKDQDQQPVVDVEITNKMLLNIHERIGVVKRIDRGAVVKLWSVRIGVAVVLAVLAFSPFLWFKDNAAPKMVTSVVIAKPLKNDVKPGGNKATLTLADGSIITLDDKKNGSLADQGNTKIIKLDGKLVYDASAKNRSEVLYNTITTPAGGQYQIELPDGSVVWLNAGSSLHFPTAFVGKERQVEITGEAYFDVKRNTAMPFKVKVRDAEIKVLGTEFNIMAYEDEAVLKTTLITGKVNFAHGGEASILKPGQQSQLTTAGKVKTVSGVNLDEVTAWKNGLFDFEGADIVTVAKQLSRWYDVKMVFERKIDDLFFAKIPRNTNLKDVLKALELTGKVKFLVDGRRIIVKGQN
jgi:transmembrane sensor